MTKATYNYTVVDKSFGKVLLIRDTNGPMSITNDIENVIEEICSRHNINPVDHHIIYRDSQGTWDAFTFSTKQFVLLQTSDLEKALAKYSSQL